MLEILTRLLVDQQQKSLQAFEILAYVNESPHESNSNNQVARGSDFGQCQFASIRDMKNLNGTLKALYMSVVVYMIIKGYNDASLLLGLEIRRIPLF